MSDIILTNTISVYAKQVPMNDMNVLDKLEIQQVGQTSHLRNTTGYQCITRKILSLHKPCVFPPAGRCNAMWCFPL